MRKQQQGDRMPAPPPETDAEKSAREDKFVKDTFNAWARLYPDRKRP